MFLMVSDGFQVFPGVSSSNPSETWPLHGPTVAELWLGLGWCGSNAPRPGHLSNQPVHPAQNPGKALEAPEDLGGRNSHNFILILDIFVEPF